MVYSLATEYNSCVIDSNITEDSEPFQYLLKSAGQKYQSSDISGNIYLFIWEGSTIK